MFIILIISSILISFGTITRLSIFLSKIKELNHFIGNDIELLKSREEFHHIMDKIASEVIFSITLIVIGSYLVIVSVFSKFGIHSKLITVNDNLILFLLILGLISIALGFILCYLKLTKREILQQNCWNLLFYYRLRVQTISDEAENRFEKYTRIVRDEFWSELSDDLHTNVYPEIINKIENYKISMDKLLTELNNNTDFPYIFLGEAGVNLGQNISTGLSHPGITIHLLIHSFNYDKFSILRLLLPKKKHDRYNEIELKQLARSVMIYEFFFFKFASYLIKNVMKKEPSVFNEGIRIKGKVENEKFNYNIPNIENNQQIHEIILEISILLFDQVEEKTKLPSNPKYILSQNFISDFMSRGVKNYKIKDIDITFQNQIKESKTEINNLLNHKIDFKSFFLSIDNKSLFEIIKLIVEARRKIIKVLISEIQKIQPYLEEDISRLPWDLKKNLELQTILQKKRDLDRIF